MENYDRIIDDSFHAKDELYINAEAKIYLKTAAKWARFLAIVGFVVVGLLLVGAFFIGAFLSMMPLYENLSVGLGGVLSGIYLVVAAIYFFPILYLYRFASSMLVALERDELMDFNYALANLSKHYRFIGIFMAIMLVFYALSLLATVFLGTM